MHLKNSARIFFLCVLIAFFSQCNSCHHLVIPQDISPDMANGSTRRAACTSGLISALAGSESCLFAIAFNAGVWKSVKGGMWNQLSDSPRYASLLAVDPTNPAHVVVGEREGEARLPILNRTGIWESFDAGDSWRLTFSPMSWGGCRTSGRQAVTDVFFSPAGTLFIATSCGVGRKAAGATQFAPVSIPAGVTDVSTFTASWNDVSGSTIIWGLAQTSQAGSAGIILFSEDDGLTWNSQGVPQKVGRYGISFSLARGDWQNLAAYGQTAIMSFKPTADSDPSVWDATKDNFIVMLYFHIPNRAFGTQVIPNSGDGTGCGGRKRLRGFLLNATSPSALGKTQRIFFSAAQDVFELEISQRGGWSWSRRASTIKSAHDPTDDLHPDIWDVHADALTGTLRLATDGGVYKLLPDLNWVTHNQGLFTHHIHNVLALPSQNKKTLVPQLCYTTSDNDEWRRDWRAKGSMQNGWKSYLCCGDADWTTGDQAVKNLALISRLGNFVLYTDFDQGRPVGASIGPKICFRPLCDPGPALVLHSYWGPWWFQVIQTLKDETPEPLLDVVMLADLPLSVWDPVDGMIAKLSDGPLANVTSVTGAPILIRNRKFLANPDAVPPFTGWELVANNLPVGTQAVHVSNGHKDPVFYIEAVDGGVRSIYRKDYGEQDWHQLNGIGGTVVNLKGPYGPDGFKPIGFGPLSVDPYDPDHLFVVTTDGIRYSPPGTKVGEDTVFLVDDVLTALLSQSGTYDLNTLYWGGHSSGALLVTRSSARHILAEMAFHRDKPRHVLAASPVAGLFVSTDEKQNWRSLTPYLPTPFTQIGGVAIEGDTAYAAFEGRGLWRFMNYASSKAASYFKVGPFGDPKKVASLHGSDTSPISGIKVTVRVVDNGLETEMTCFTDGNGVVTVPNATGKAVHILFDGNDDFAPCAVSLVGS